MHGDRDGQIRLARARRSGAASAGPGAEAAACAIASVTVLMLTGWFRRIARCSVSRTAAASDTLLGGPLILTVPSRANICTARESRMSFRCLSAGPKSMAVFCGFSNVMLSSKFAFLRQCFTGGIIADTARLLEIREPASRAPKHISNGKKEAGRPFRAAPPVLPQSSMTRCAADGVMASRLS